jgi:hypothetical protein
VGKRKFKHGEVVRLIDDLYRDPAFIPFMQKLSGTLVVFLRYGNNKSFCHVMEKERYENGESQEKGLWAISVSSVLPYDRPEKIKAILKLIND